MTPSRARSGFTLIELVVVLVVIGIISLAIGPAWLQPATRDSFADSIEPLTNLLRDARREAMDSGAAVTLVIDPQSRRYLLARDSSAHSSYSAREDVVPVAGDVQLRHDSARVRFRFWPDGRAYGDSLIVSSHAGMGRVLLRLGSGEVTIAQ
jgi:type II secretion system protein H